MRQAVIENSAWVIEAHSCHHAPALLSFDGRGTQYLSLQEAVCCTVFVQLAFMLQRAKWRQGLLLECLIKYCTCFGNRVARSSKSEGAGVQGEGMLLHIDVQLGCACCSEL